MVLSGCMLPARLTHAGCGLQELCTLLSARTAARAQGSAVVTILIAASVLEIARHHSGAQPLAAVQVQGPRCCAPPDLHPRAQEGGEQGALT